MFKSVQCPSGNGSGGRNIVLFNKTSRVADADPGVDEGIERVSLFVSDA